MVPALDDFPHNLSQESSTRGTRGWNFFYTGEQGEPVGNSEMATSVLFSGSIKQECCQKYSCHFENTVCIFLVFPWGLSNLFLTREEGWINMSFVLCSASCFDETYRNVVSRRSLLLCYLLVEIANGFKYC